MKFLLIVILSTILCGCSPFEVRDNLVGMYPADMNRMGNKAFDFEAGGTTEEAFEKILTFLKSKKMHILKQDKRRFFIVADNFKAIFPYCIDTTKVSFLIEEIETNKIKIKVACRNHDLAKEAFQAIKQMINKK